MKKGNVGRIICLSFSGIFVLVFSLIISKVLLPGVICRKVRGFKCVDSIEYVFYKQWVGNVTNRPNNQQLKIYYWNLTNKNEFMYAGAPPQFQEIGPYVYTFDSGKVNVEFQTGSVKYQTMRQYQYSPQLTKQYCTQCEKNDKITTVNMGYHKLAIKSGGDKYLAYKLIHTVTKEILSRVHNITGNYSATMKIIGKKGYKIFQNNIFKQNWRFEFSAFVNELNQTFGSSWYGKINYINYSEVEMRALYNVTTCSTLMGIKKPVPTICQTDPVLKECLDTGLIYLLSVWEDTKNTSQLSIVMDRINEMFCPYNDTQCFRLDADLINIVGSYVKTNLARISMELEFEAKEYGLIITKSQDELAKGWSMEDLMIPGMSNTRGEPVTGVFVNDTADPVQLRLTKPFTEFYLCGNPPEKELTYKSINGRIHAKETFVKGSSDDFLRIEGRYGMINFLRSPKIDICKGVQVQGKSYYKVYDEYLRSTIEIEESKFKNSINVNIFKRKNDIYNINNVSVFTEGFIDLTNTNSGTPLLISDPHFLHADESLVKKFQMKPSEEKHVTHFQIEPLMGVTLQVQRRMQINTAILDNAIQSPRLKPLNIKYKDLRVPHYKHPFPLYWVEVHQYAQIHSLAGLLETLKGITIGCIMLILGPIIGTMFLLAALYIFWKKVKGSNDITDASSISSSGDEDN